MRILCSFHRTIRLRRAKVASKVGRLGDWEIGRLGNWEIGGLGKEDPERVVALGQRHLPGGVDQLAHGAQGIRQDEPRTRPPATGPLMSPKCADDADKIFLQRTQRAVQSKLPRLAAAGDDHFGPRPAIKQPATPKGQRLLHRCPSPGCRKSIGCTASLHPPQR
jgi:hypothetical protein